jgi:glycosyltransferase involved in cell wall biosynthesis
MNIFVNYFENNKLINSNTDIFYPANFELLADKDLKVYFNNNYISLYHFILFYSLKSLSGKIKLDLAQSHLLHKYFHTVYIPPAMLKGIDLFFSHCYFPFGLRARGIPVLTNHGFMTNDYKEVVHDEDRCKEVKQICEMSRFSTFMTFSSENAIERFCSFAPHMRSKIKLAPFLIPKIPILTPSEMQAKHLNPNLKITFVGENGLRKGITNLLAAIGNLYHKDATILSNCEFHFVTRAAVQLPAGIKFVHRPYLPNDEVLKLMRESAIFCLPTLKDAYGIVYIEAMGNGCAVLCDDKMPRKEIFMHKSAHFTDPTSTEEIEKALRKLILNPGYRLELAANAYQKFRQHYSFEVVSTYYQELFTETINAEKARGKKYLTV